MTQKFIPRPYQKLMMEHIFQNPRCALWAGMGMGKTSGVLTALETLNFLKPVYPALVVAPLRVARTTWPEEVEKWAHTQHLKVSPIIGDFDERMKALHTKADIYTTNYEQLEWLVKLYGKKWPFRSIISDESTKLKSFRIRQGGKRAKALYQASWLDKVELFIELTGTPSPNGLQDLHGQIHFLDQGQRLGRSYTAFSQRWFQKSWDGFGITPLPHAQKEIEDSLQDLCLSIEAKDWFDLKDPIESTVYIDLPPKAQKLYKDMESEMFMQLGEDDVEAFNAASRTMKCLQLANGAAYVGENAERWVEVHNEKIEALKSIQEEAAGMPLLVAYNFRSDLDRLLKAFPRGRVLDKSPKTIKDWNKGKIPILFAHPASAGHGLNLQDGSNIIVFFGHNWNLEEYMQIIERIGPTRQMQAGYDRPVFIYHIVARGTVEELVMARLESKRSVQDLLMEAMKRRKDDA